MLFKCPLCGTSTEKYELIYRYNRHYLEHYCENEKCCINQKEDPFIHTVFRTPVTLGSSQIDKIPKNFPKILYTLTTTGYYQGDLNAYINTGNCFIWLWTNSKHGFKIIREGVLISTFKKFKERIRHNHTVLSEEELLKQRAGNRLKEEAEKTLQLL